MRRLPARARALVLALAAVPSFACSRTPRRNTPTGGDAVAVSAPAAPTMAAENPFARTFSCTTARIVYEKKDGSLKRLILVKNGRVREETTAGLFADGSYSLTDGAVSVNVIPSRRKVVRFRSGETHSLEEYRKLDAAAQAAVQKSVVLVGPDIPLYMEGSPTRIADRDIHGLRASCYRLSSRITGDVSERCYWRGIQLSLAGKNPIDGSDLHAEATEVVLDAPLDDTLFAIPSDYAEEVGSTDEIMHGVYAQLVDRMRSPRFALEHLDRYAQSP